MDIVIYGAQGYALGTYEAIRELWSADKVMCFCVTEMGLNNPVLAGLPVVEINELDSNMSQ